MKILACFIIFLFLFACSPEPKKDNLNRDTVAVAPPQKEVTPPEIEKKRDTLPQKAAVNPYKKANIEVKTFQNKDGAATGTWGYSIYIDKNPYINQPSMPSVPGNNGFSTEAKARKAAELVAYKIKHNIMPPAVSPHELDSIGVLH